ncbi:MAG TPA: choice-of-anchor Q domain-containing protein, partial [Prosthecobacter sp.]|nr:choice-of-anchor Q domain-containing protein [Prosthecobacter sp.]
NQAMYNTFTSIHNNYPGVKTMTTAYDVSFGTSPTSSFLWDLAPLASYGGPTQTLALLPGSPARNAATGTATSDQRGFPIIGTPDIGAYEAGNNLATIYNAWIWETLPAIATTPQHATTFDFDGDGQTNEAEWLALTDAANPNSRFAATPARNGANLEITVPTAAGRIYTLLQSGTLVGGSWSAAPGFTPQPGTGIPIIFQVPIASTRMFYSVQVSP